MRRIQQKRSSIAKLVVIELNIPFETVRSTHDKYHISEFEDIAKKLKSYFGLSFEVDYANALLSCSEAGKHHPDNFQLILKAHNSKKNNDSWKRFTFDEQVEYINTAIKLQLLVALRFGDELNENILFSLISRLKNIY